MFLTHFVLGEVVRLLETDGDFLVRETVRNEEKQIVLSVIYRFSYLLVDAYLFLDLYYNYLQRISSCKTSIKAVNNEVVSPNSYSFKYK